MKYIDADKLIAEIERRMTDYNASIEKYYGKQKSIKAERDSWKWAECKWFLALIASLRQELPEVQDGKFVFPKYLYARTKDNKTIDMSYAPQDMTAVEYIRNDFVEQKQPENKDKIMNFFDAVGDCGFSQHDILLLKNIWKESGCPPPKSQVADASKMEQPEVDLEEEIDAFFDKWDKNSNGCFFDENGALVTIKTIKDAVKHLLNARKEE